MKRFLFIFFFLFIGISGITGQVIRTDTVIVNKTKFLFVKSISTNESSGNDDSLCKVYRLKNDSAEYLLTHVLYATDADCNSVFRDYGTFEIKSDSIIFMTEFEVERNKNFGLPYRRKQIYVVNNNGKMILVYDRSEMEDGVWKDNLSD